MGDTRNNWVTMEFNTKCRFNCFRKQSHIDTCTEGFRELERFGFEFGEFGFAMNQCSPSSEHPKTILSANCRDHAEIVQCKKDV